MISMSSPAAARWWRTFRGGLWLGWKIESNWTDPYLFTVYSLARPVAGSLILVFMYLAAAGRHTAPNALGFLVVGTAFWPFVLAGVRGMVLGIIEDREQWKTLRAIYTAPVSYRAYLVGRSLAQMLAVATPGSAVALLIGWLWLHVHFDLSWGRAGIGALALAIGFIGIIAVGTVATGLVLSMSVQAWQLPEAIALALYLVCGAIFPVHVLPAVLEKVASVMPMTWWLDAMRSALLGPRALTSFPWASDWERLGILALLTVVFVIGGAFIFSVSETHARRKGILDQESMF
jgi:ABC-2 type transport system permease protein